MQRRRLEPPTSQALGSILRRDNESYVLGVPFNDDRLRGIRARADGDGGPVAYNAGTISQSYATGAVSGSYYVGGGSGVGGLVGGNAGVSRGSDKSEEQDFGIDGAPKIELDRRYTRSSNNALR